jgi:uncharacterized protein (DUF1697 family)
MHVYVALLRAINVGGTGKLMMTRLKALCDELGYDAARTYIQSGNVVFRARRAETTVKAQLSAALERELGAPVGVLLRTAAELRATLEHNPFPEANARRVIAFFLDRAPGKAALAGVVTPGGERVRAIGREIFVHYPDGQGRSKLKLPAARQATGRNLNTIAALVEIAEQLPGTAA